MGSLANVTTWALIFHVVAQRMNHDEIIQSPLQTSALLEVGNAIRHCDSAVLEESLDSVIQQLVFMIKRNSDTFTISAVMSVTKELIKRLAASSIKDPTLQSFSSLVSAILSLHSLPSLSSQSTVLNCLSSVVRLYSSGVKPFQQSIMEWARKGLYSDHYQLVQESAVLVVLLYSCGRKPENLSELFNSSVQLLQFLLQLLIGDEETVVIPSDFHLSPSLPMEGQERLSAIARAIRSVSRLLCYCLAIENSCQCVALLLSRLVEVLCFAVDCKIMSMSLRESIQQSTWQLFLVIIQRCGLQLLPYSDLIEAGIGRVFQEEDTPPLITALVCRCADEWIEIRGCHRLFVYHVASSLCLTGHKCLQKICNYSCKAQISYDGPEVWLLYYCISTLCVCIKDSYDCLPDSLREGLYWLGSEMPRSVPPELLAKTKELKTLTENHAIVLDAMMKKMDTSALHLTDKQDQSVTGSIFTGSTVLHSSDHTHTSSLLKVSPKPAATSTKEAIIIGSSPLLSIHAAKRLSISSDFMPESSERPHPKQSALLEQTTNTTATGQKQNDFSLADIASGASCQKSMNNPPNNTDREKEEDSVVELGVDTASDEEELLMEIFSD